jgi:tRNA modification GTPase
MAMAATIFALSSASGRAGVAVIRISGPGALAALTTLAPGARPVPRRALRVGLVDPADGTALDAALALWFPAPRSFTGDDVVELHVHGGVAVVAGVLATLGRLAGLQPAEPGAFTRRAFENGKIDLTEAEGLADLIDAETEAQRRLALRQLGGALHRAAEAWREDLLKAQALVEAAIDFSDEGDVSSRAVADAVGVAETVRASMQAALGDAHKGEILRDGFRVVIAGPPNAGKSSLLNALARREAAIVSPEAGTTRDVVELHLNLGGLAVVLADTAGLRPVAEGVEKEGIRRAVTRAQGADLVLWVVDATAPDPYFPPELHRLSGEVFRVRNKIDLLGVGLPDEKMDAASVWLSTRTGDGIGRLEEKIAAAARSRTQGGEQALITTARHRHHIAAAAAALGDFLAGDRGALELRAEDLRLAAQALGRLVGRVDAEEILGAIFGRFCIGK